MVAHTSSNGVTGMPTRADAARGAALLQEIGEALAELIGRARAEKPPLEWSRTTDAFAA
jgi:creatinine amidohydrolase/Fe(II)-dependent formamide hydrolase-like protein